VVVEQRKLAARAVAEQRRLVARAVAEQRRLAARAVAEQRRLAAENPVAVTVLTNIFTKSFINFMDIYELQFTWRRVPIYIRDSRQPRIYNIYRRYPSSSRRDIG
jgi:hypothetical protein